MSDKYAANAEGAGNNGNGGVRRERDGRMQAIGSTNGSSAQPSAIGGRGYTGTFDFDEMIASLRDLFAHDRQIASQAENKRCGICYLYFTPGELVYREEEGFYACANCARTLGKQNLPMLRRQQK